MKTKFILHGGFAGHVNSENDAFFKEILKDAPNDPKVLLVYFAKEIDRIPVSKAEDIFQFERNKNNRNLSFEVAEEGRFPEQVKRSDIVYLHGGATLKLIDALKKHSNLKELFKGKVIAGESAGAYALSAFFYSKTAGDTFTGLGLVPAKVICHYIGQNANKLKEGPENLEVLLLLDYKYKVFL